VDEEKNKSSVSTASKGLLIASGVCFFAACVFGLTVSLVVQSLLERTEGNVLLDILLLAFGALLILFTVGFVLAEAYDRKSTVRSNNAKALKILNLAFAGAMAIGIFVRVIPLIM